jgi:hypothetical protein
MSFVLLLNVSLFASFICDHSPHFRFTLIALFAPPQQVSFTLCFSPVSLPLFARITLFTPNHVELSSHPSTLLTTVHSLHSRHSLRLSSHVSLSSPQTMWSSLHTPPLFSPPCTLFTLVTLFASLHTYHSSPQTMRNSLHSLHTPPLTLFCTPPLTLFTRSLTLFTLFRSQVLETMAGSIPRLVARHAAEAKTKHRTPARCAAIEALCSTK